MITTFTIRNVANEDGAAQISDFGAHVLSRTPAGGHPAVWQPKAVYLGEPIRGGVPVVLPWFALGSSMAKSTVDSVEAETDWPAAESCVGPGVVLRKVFSSVMVPAYPFGSSFTVRYG